MFAAVCGHRDSVDYFLGADAGAEKQSLLGGSALQMARVTGTARALVGRFRK